MLVGFIGCPCSGKTTTAAMTFADLKHMGISAEFIPEQARLYIAQKRFESPDGRILLTDEDQKAIMKTQATMEIILHSGLPDGVVITDSSVLNTLLYLSSEARNSEETRAMVTAAIGRYDLTFYSAPVKASRNLDPNRLQNEDQSLALDRAIPTILKDFAPDLTPIHLFGDSKQRHHEVTRTILEALAR
jgi:hypothetical protein